MNKITVANGERSTPARTCAELADNFPHLKSGEFWVDPNGGKPDDAIKVHCNIEQRSTCILPEKSKFREVNPQTTSTEIWLGEVDSDLKISYQADSNQIRYLQILSERASQDITYHCKRSVAVYNKEKSTFRQGLKLLAYNEAELTAKGQKLRYEVIQDDCKVSSTKD